MKSTNSKHLATLGLAALLVSTSGALAGSDTDLTMARSYILANDSSSYDALLANTNLADLKIGVEVQARYAYNSRDGVTPSDDETTTGFSLRRSKVGIEGNVTDNMKGKIKFAFDRKDGSANLEDAYLDWTINDEVTLRLGQFKQSFLREETMSATRQLASERSLVNAAFTQDFSQGIEAMFGADAWRGMIGFTDGFNTDNTAYNSASETDYAFNGRFEMRFGDAEWSQFKQFTSWRGSNSGGLLGAALAYQSSGDTNPSDPAGSSDTTSATIDFSWVADGWNLYAAGIWRSSSPAGGTDTDDYGILVQGGFFVSDQDELFGRWETLLPDDSNAPNDEDFNAVTFGWNHYFIPESHAAKFTLEVLYALDAVDTNSLAAGVASDGRNLLASPEDGQLGVTAQFQFMF